MGISRPTVTDAGPRARCGASEVNYERAGLTPREWPWTSVCPGFDGPGSKPEAAVRPLIEASRGLSFIVLSNARRRKQRHMPVLLHRGRRRAAKTPRKDGTRRSATSRPTPPSLRLSPGPDQSGPYTSSLPAAWRRGGVLIDIQSANPTSYSLVRHRAGKHTANAAHNTAERESVRRQRY